MPAGDLRRRSSPGEERELERLAERFRLPLLRFFERRVASVDDAEELSQEVFVRLLRRTDLREVDNLEGFVFVVAANLLKDHYRQKARHRDTGPLLGMDVESSAPSPSAIVEGRADLGVLLAAIDELAPKCRAAFVMYRFDEVVSVAPPR